MTALVVSGLGTVGGYGIGATALAEALYRARPNTAPVEPPAGLPGRRERLLPVHLVDSLPITEWLPGVAARRMSKTSRFAVVAALEALDDAGLSVEPPVDPDFGVVVGTTFGPVTATQKLLDQYLEHGPEFMSPGVFSECVANAPAAHISLQCRAGGPNLTVVHREAGAIGALLAAAELISSGRATRALAGTTEEMSPLLVGLLDGFRALSPTEARPFDLRRDGYVPAEGSTVVLLEGEERVADRGGTSRCRLICGGIGFDPSSSSTSIGCEPARTGRQIRAAMLARGTEPTQVDLIVSGASGSRPGDHYEALCLREIWGDEGLPAVTAPKGVTGEYAGGHLATAILAAQGGICFPTTGFEFFDESLGITPAREAASTPDATGGTVFASTFSTGGHYAWAILEG